ncbi:4507_t:CDS:2 [Gigaspora rosea]|nr:4507_t:CDS:2 [Gigaspora rosea]
MKLSNSSTTIAMDNEFLWIEGKWIKDSTDRTLMFHGVNLSGSSKNPPNIPSHNLARLKHWGFNFLRFIVTWEALEHQGLCLIYPHQDVVFGGSGAPGWTLDIAGLDMKNLLLLMLLLFIILIMIQTQKCIIDGINIQDYLQSHYFNAYKTLASKICEAGLHDSLVIGCDSINEPSWGFVSTKDLNHIPDHQEYKRGATSTTFQAMLLGKGNPCTIQVWDITWYGFGVVGSEYVYPKGCIWAAHGVWDKKTKTISYCFKPFVTQYAEAIRSVYQDAIILVQPPIFELLLNMIDDINPLKRIIYSSHWYDGLTLTQKKFNWYNIDVLGIKRGRYPTNLNAIKIGNKAIRKNIADQIGLLISEQVNYVGDCPCVIGEIGIPYDLDNRKAYENGDYTQQIKAMDANLQALESNLVNYTLWTYVPDNSNEWGDQWNGEDLSIYSAPTENTLEKIHSMMSTPDSHQILDIGGRALDSLLRPFPIKTNGEPLSLSFDPYKKVFKYRFKNDKFNPEKNTPTEIYLPRFHYPERDDFAITFLSGYADFDRDNQLLLYWHDLGDPADDRSDPNYGIHEIIVEFKKPLLGGEGIWDDCC